MRLQRFVSLFLAVGVAAGALAARSAPPSTLGLAAGAQRSARRTHQATGELVSITSGSLVLLHARGRTKQRMTFVLTPDTTRGSNLVKGARVTVFYEVDKSGRLLVRRVRAARVRASRHAPRAKAQH